MPERLGSSGLEEKTEVADAVFEEKAEVEGDAEEKGEVEGDAEEKRGGAQPETVQPDKAPSALESLFGARAAAAAPKAAAPPDKAPWDNAPPDEASQADNEEVINIDEATGGIDAVMNIDDMTASSADPTADMSEKVEALTGERSLIEQKKAESLMLHQQALEEAEKEAMSITDDGNADDPAKPSDGSEAKAGQQMRLHSLIRGQLFAIGRPLVSVGDNGQPVPASPWAEEIFQSIFRTYSDDGLMSLEHWSLFMEDAEVINTYTPHDGDASAAFRHSIAPEVTFPAVAAPRNDPKDEAVSYTLFLKLLFYLCRQIATQDMNLNSIDGYNQMLNHLVLPLCTWGRKNSKRAALALGSRHPLVPGPGELIMDGRVLLLLQAYLPNLWRVFLYYAQDPGKRTERSHGGTMPPQDLPFPEGAQQCEGLLSPDLCTHFQNSMPSLNGGRAFFMSESNMVRFAQEFGLCPGVCSAKTVTQLFRSMAFPLISSESAMHQSWLKPPPSPRSTGPGGLTLNMNASRSPNSPASPRSPSTGLTLSALRRNQLTQSKRSAIEDKEKLRKTEDRKDRQRATISRTSRKGGLHAGAKVQVDKMGSGTILLGTISRDLGNGRYDILYDHGGTESGAFAHNITLRRSAAVKGTAPQTGIGFCHFVELIGCIAVSGLKRPPYSGIYPTPLAKVMALNTGPWGIANPDKLEAARVLEGRADPNSPQQKFDVSSPTKNRYS